MDGRFNTVIGPGSIAVTDVRRLMKDRQSNADGQYEVLNILGVTVNLWLSAYALGSSF